MRTRRSTTFDIVTTEATLRQMAETRGVKAGALIHATRVALTGQAVSPGLFEVAALVGQGGTVSAPATARAFPPVPASLTPRKPSWFLRSTC